MHFTERLSKPPGNQKPPEPSAKAKFKRTIKDATTASTAANRDEDVRASEKRRKMTANMRATSENVTQKNTFDGGNSRQLPPPLRPDSTRNNIKSLTQVITPRDTSTNSLKKSYTNIRKDTNALTMPPVNQRKERVVMSRGGEERREKLILKDKLPNFRAEQRPPSSIPNTNTNKAGKSEPSTEKKVIFISRSPPSKLLLNNKTVASGPFRITRPTASDAPTKSTNNGLLSSTSSDSLQSVRNLPNLTIRTRSPNIQPNVNGMETPLSGKRVKTELGPEERERRRLQYVAPTSSNKYRVLLIG